MATRPAEINARLNRLRDLGWELRVFQSNTEGALIDALKRHAPDIDG